MFKKLIIFSTIAVLGGCETINQEKQCDPEKNYIISNPQAIEEYKKLKSEGKIRSYYHNDQTYKSCDNNQCAGFNPENYDFIEMYFDSDKRKGIYKIIATKDLSDKECLTVYTMSTKQQKKYCYKAIKNEDAKILSEYEWKLDKINDLVILEFNNIKTKESLFKFSYQTYSTGAIGGPGGGICPQSYINNPTYKFNPYSFP